MRRLGNWPSLIFSIASLFILVIFCTSIVLAQVEPPSEIELKLASISEEEKRVLENLFTLEQDIGALEREEKELAANIEVINDEIKHMETVIAEEESTYSRRQEALKQVLKSYQRTGPGTYLEIIFNSESLTSLLRRLNTLRDIASNTGELLSQLEQSKLRLSEEKAKLADRKTIMEEKRRMSAVALAEKLKLKISKEEYLASLKGEKEQYQKYLADVQQMWSDLKPFFSQVAMEFTDIIKAGAIPQNAVRISLSLFGIKGSIEEKTFNEIASKRPNLAKMQFDFQEGRIEVKLPDKNLTLAGSFVIINGNSLKFQVEEGSFYGLPLKPASLEELFSQGDLILDFKSVLGRNTINSIEIKEGLLELVIN